MSRWKQFLASEKEKTKNLNAKQKISYIWDYYKVWITVIVCLVTTVSYVGVRAVTTLSDHWFYIGFIGTQADVSNDSELYKGYIDYTGYDLNEKLVEFDNRLYFDYAQNKGRGNRYFEVFCAYIDAGTLDACTMSKDALISFGESGRLLDLDNEKCSSIKEKYGDRFLYCQPIDEAYSTEAVAVGIDISDSILMTKYKMSDKDCALGISAYSENIDAVEKFLDYIFTEE